MVVGNTVVRFKASVALMVMLGAAIPAQAGLILNITQVGGNVVTTESGSINSLAGLGSSQPEAISVGLTGRLVVDVVGSPTSNQVIAYRGIIGPGSFGSSNNGGGTVTPSSGSGPEAGVYGFGDTLFLPVNYTLGSTLTGTDTYTGQTLSSLDMTPGTYTYTFTGGSVTVNIGIAATVPEPSSLVLTGLGGIAALG